MEGKVFGIPVIILVLALAIAALVDVPMFLINATNQAHFTALENAQLSTQNSVSQLIPTPEPTASASATPTPLVKTLNRSFVPAATTTGRVK